MYFKQLTTPVPQAILPAYQVGYSDNNPGRTPEQVAELSIEQIIKETRTRGDSANILNYYFANKELCGQPLLLAILLHDGSDILYDEKIDTSSVKSLMSILKNSGLFTAYMDGKQSFNEFCSEEFNKCPEYYEGDTINRATLGMKHFTEFYFTHDELTPIGNDDRYLFCINRLAPHKQLRELARIYAYHIDTNNQKKQDEILKYICDNKGKMLAEYYCYSGTRPSGIIENVVNWQNADCDNKTDQFYNDNFVPFNQEYSNATAFFLFRVTSQLSNTEAKKKLVQIFLPYLKPIQITNDNIQGYINIAAYNRYLYEYIASIINEQEYIELANQWKNTFESLVHETNKKTTFLQKILPFYRRHVLHHIIQLGQNSK